MHLRDGDTVLFQGDSITNAFRRPEEINTAYQMGAGYALLVAAHLQATRPRARLTFCNRAISGEGIVALGVRWVEDTLALRPDMLSLLVGINDVANAAGTARPDIAAGAFAGAYDRLLGDTRDALPDVRLVLVPPFALPCGIVTDAWLPHLRTHQAAVVELAERHGATLVDAQSAFDAACHDAPSEYWMYDGIHPTAAGHGLLARVWMDAALGTPDALGAAAPAVLTMAARSNGHHPEAPAAVLTGL